MATCWTLLVGLPVSVTSKDPLPLTYIAVYQATKSLKHPLSAIAMHAGKD